MERNWFYDVIVSLIRKGQLISKCIFGVFDFLQKTKKKQVDLRFHSSKVEFFHSCFGGNVGLQKSFRLCMTFSSHIGMYTLKYITE